MTVRMEANAEVPDGSVSLVLLAGGVGKRMGAAIPKQYLPLRGKPIATYSLITFSKMKVVRSNQYAIKSVLHFHSHVVSSIMA
jgi:2-C-methyl-D-erythritol 4-phosphate cytidylyltransferase